MNDIRLTNDTIGKDHICCTMKSRQSLTKKEWLKTRFDKGPVLSRSGQHGKCVTEYIPAEYE